MRKSQLLMIGIVTLILAAGPVKCADLANSEEQLNTAVQKYIQCHKQQDYKCVWDLWSRRLKEGNDNDQAKFERDFLREGFHPSDSVVQKIEEAANTALLTVTVTYVDNATGRRYGSAVEEWKFVKENGSWLFDDHKTLSESP